MLAQANPGGSGRCRVPLLAADLVGGEVGAAGGDGLLEDLDRLDLFDLAVRGRRVRLVTRCRRRAGSTPAPEIAMTYSGSRSVVAVT